MPEAVCQGCGAKVSIHAAEAFGILQGGSISKTCPECESRELFKAAIDSEVEPRA